MNAREIAQGYASHKSLRWLIKRIDEGENSTRDMPQVDILQQAGAFGLSHIDLVMLNRCAMAGLRDALQTDLREIERKFKKAKISLDDEEHM